MSIVPTESDVDSRWLTERLQDAGVDAHVTAVRRTQIGTGQIGKCIRYELEFAGATAAPRSLVGKFPSDDPLSRATGVQLRNYIKEVSFYQNLQKRLGIATPRCYYAAIDGEGPDFMLLLEDLAPAQQGDQLNGCDERVARAAVRELVGLHTPSWCDESLRGISWLGEPDPSGGEMIRGLYNAQLPGFMDRYGDRIDADQRRVIERLGESPLVLGRPLGSPFSLVHIDYRLDNLLINDATNPPEVTVVDWQSITLGNPLTDVAYFLGAGMIPADRRPVEEQLVRDYHRQLTAAGVTDYAWESCWEDYRRGSFAGFPVTVVASMLVQQTKRGDEMFAVMADRHSRHALDLGATDFL